jgi:hypothetical protein
MALITGIIYIRRTNELQKTCKKNRPNEKKEECYLMPTSNKKLASETEQERKKNNKRRL